MSCFCAQIFNESQRELLRDERVRVSLEIPNSWATFRDCLSSVCPYVPTGVGECSGQCRRRKRVTCTCCEGRRAEGWGAEPRALINETYAAAADTEMHCKYSISKKTIVPGRDLCLFQLHSHRGVRYFFIRRNNSRWACFLESMATRKHSRYRPVVNSCIYMGQKILDR